MKLRWPAVASVVVAILALLTLGLYGVGSGWWGEPETAGTPAVVPRPSAAISDGQAETARALGADSRRPDRGRRATDPPPGRRAARRHGSS